MSLRFRKRVLVLLVALYLFAQLINVLAWQPEQFKYLKVLKEIQCSQPDTSSGYLYMCSH